MIGIRRSFSAELILVFLVIILCQATCNIMGNEHKCSPSSCGPLRNISNPFRLKGDPEHCGDKRYEFSCDNNLTVLHLLSGTYYVQSINYNNYTIRVLEASIFDHKDNCSFIPQYSLTFVNFTETDLYCIGEGFWYNKHVVFMNCANLVNSSLFVDTNTCDIDATYSSRSGGHSYAVAGFMPVSELNISCRINKMVMASWPDSYDPKNISYKDIHDMLTYGFELSWAHPCVFCSGHSRHYIFRLFSYCGRVSIWKKIYYFIQGFYYSNYFFEVSKDVVIFFSAKHALGTVCVIAFLVYKWRRRHLSMYNNIEEYLQSQNNLNPIRYSYSDIKKMTRRFKHKLGEGGFGSVYKGTLRSGSFVAVKMLSSKSKANGQDFINEVATIGRIYHVNVVQLIGFCVEGSKRALVYDFMPNGSLDKYIFAREGSIPLSTEKMFEISLGIARGIEYLHRGCEMQILHFDIKPHNILLAENFTAKISDFGLARLYSAKESIVNLTAARGTIGYMAPELCYKNIGGVSYKADVYSFGTLLMEMAGKRKNVNAHAEHSSQIYFPSWAYDQLSKGKDVGIEDVTEEEMVLTKKMMIVALWCIQMKPSERPAMNKVLEMLEGELESLQMPPYKPLEFPKETHPMEILGETSNPSCSSIPSDDWSSESVSLILSSK